MIQSIIRRVFVVAALAAMAISASAARAATVTSGGSDTGSSGTKDAWRTNSVAKPLDLNHDDIYGTNGYILFRFNSGTGSVPFSTTSNNTVNALPSYLTVSSVSGGADLMYGSKAAIDNPAGGADVSSGITFRSLSASANVEFAFLQITVSAHPLREFKLGVISNTSGGTDIPLDLRLAQTAGAGTDSVSFAVPNENQPDYYFFDIANAHLGDVFTLYTTSRGGKPTISGFTVDAIPTPAALPAGLALLGLAGLRRRRA